MSVEQFEHVSMVVLISGLICFMAFIVWDLAKRSNAGRLGTFALFFALGFGVAGFIVKTVLIEVFNI